MIAWIIPVGYAAIALLILFLGFLALREDEEPLYLFEDEDEDL